MDRQLQSAAPLEAFCPAAANKALSSLAGAAGSGDRSGAEANGVSSILHRLGKLCTETQALITEEKVK